MEDKNLEDMTMDEKVEDFYNYFSNKKEYNLPLELGFVVGQWNNTYGDRNKNEDAANEYTKTTKLLNYYRSFATRGEEDNITVMKAYLYSNENLNKLFESSEIDVKDKKVMLVGTGLCQAYNAILNGASEITICDANVMLEPAGELKTALMCVLNRKEFLEFYNYDFPENFFKNHNVYAKVSQYLSDEARQFWDTVALEGDQKILEVLFHRDCCYHGSSFYKKDSEYNRLQKLLLAKNFKINYKVGNFCDFPTMLNDQYDFMSFSNIKEYYNNVDDFYNVLKTLYDKNLAYGGVMQTNSRLYDWDKIEEVEKLNQLLPSARIFKIKGSGLISRKLMRDERDSPTAWDSVFVKKEKTSTKCEEKDCVQGK